MYVNVKYSSQSWRRTDSLQPKAFSLLLSIMMIFLRSSPQSTTNDTYSLRSFSYKIITDPTPASSPCRQCSNSLGWELFFPCTVSLYRVSVVYCHPSEHHPHQSTGLDGTNHHPRAAWHPLLWERTLKKTKESPHMTKTQAFGEKQGQQREPWKTPPLHCPPFHH